MNEECKRFVQRGGIDKDHLSRIHGPRFTLAAENCARRALNEAMRRESLKQGEAKTN